MNLKNKKILITGAAKRIGKSIAMVCAQKGAHILLHYYASEKEAKNTQQAILRLGSPCSLYQANLCKSEEVKDLIQQILKTEKRVDVLINNASLFYPKTLEETQKDDLDVFLNIHLKAPFLLAQTFGPLMKKRGEGHILNLIDAGISNPQPRYLAYASSKAALLAFSQGLARSLAPEVQVNCISPGQIFAPENYSKKMKDQIIQKTLREKWAGSEEISRMVLFLLESDFITGQNFFVDGA
ncbi:MAG: SDR family oxidoreductase [Deltaproteobacteria bacterium]|nr:SDR family oxidoreductase [Deltaproteobacteria bacterium]